MIPGLVRVLTWNGQTAGAGFLVSEAGLVITSAHVVGRARSAPGRRIRFHFLNSGERREGIVKPEWWRDENAEDVAVVCMTRPLPKEETSVNLATSANAIGREFKTFGFPADKPVEGSVGLCKVVGETREHGHRVLQIRSSEVTQGFSGAPVIDERLNAVIGIVTSILREDEFGKQSETSFIIPVETLRDVCPQLAIVRGNPYRGLEYFDEDDTQLYFGRDAAAEELLAILSERDFVLLIGVSGCGKSSLVRAGLAKALGRDTGIPLAAMKRMAFAPGERPHVNLLLALAEEFDANSTASAFDLPGPLPQALTTKRYRAALEDRLATVAPEMIAKSVQKLSRDAGLIIIADQFERLFTECDDAFRRNHFLSVLIGCASANTKVIVAARADHYHHLMDHTGVAAQMKLGQVNLGHMSEEELREAIEGPARYHRCSFEPGLVAGIVRDIAGRAGDLPLLQFALTQLWERSAMNGVLSREAYDALGMPPEFPGLHGAIARQAEAIWRDMDEPAQRAARRVFLRLVTPGEADESGKQVARDASRREWRILFDESTQRTASKLVDARLLTSGIDASTGRPTFEVAHEAIIRAWPRLKRWVDEQRPFLRWRDETLMPRLREWMEHNRSRNYLLGRMILDEARTWLEERKEDLQGVPEDYIHESMKRQRVRTVAIIALIATVVVSSAILGAWGIINLASANREAVRAQAEANSRATTQVEGDAARATAQGEVEKSLRSELSARNSELAAVARSRLDESLGLAMLLSVEAFTTIDMPQSQSALYEAWRHNPKLRQFFHGHEEAIASVAWSEDGKLASGSADSSVIVWDTETGQPAQILRGHNGKVTSVAWSRTGSLASGSTDGRVIIWDVETGQPDRVIDYEDAAGVSSIAWSPSSELAIGTLAGEVLVWQYTPYSRLLHRLEAHEGAVSSVSWSPSGRLASGSTDQTVIVWESHGEEPEQTLTGHTGRITSLAWSRSEELASGSSDGTLIIWNLETGEADHVLRDPTASITSIAWSRDGHIASGSMDAMVMIWDPQIPLPVDMLQGQAEPVTSVAWAEDGRLASGHANGSMAVWNVWATSPIRSLVGHEGGITSLSWSPDGRLASGALDGRIVVWDMINGDPYRTLQSVWGGITSLAWSSGGLLASGSEDGVVIVWNVEEGRSANTLHAHTEPITDVDWSIDGRLASSSADGTVIVWDAETGQRVHVLRGHTDWVTSVAWAMDGRLASASYDGTVLIWQLGPPDQMQTLAGPLGRISSVAWSNNGMLASGYLSDAIVVWDTDTNDPGHILQTSLGSIYSVAWSADGRLAAGSEDGTVTVWDTQGERPSLTLQVHEAEVLGLAWSSNGYLASGSADGSLVVGLTDPDIWAQETCQRAGRNLTEAEWRQYISWRPYDPSHKTCPQWP